MGMKVFCDVCGCQIIKDPLHKDVERHIELKYGWRTLYVHTHCFNVLFSTDIERIKSIKKDGE